MDNNSSMDDFTPPPGDLGQPFSMSSPVRPPRPGQGHSQSPSVSSIPPAIPPPPTDLPEGYRAVTSSMSSRRASIETDASSPRTAGPPTRTRRGSLGHMVRAKSNKIFKHEVHKVVTPEGKTVLRKQNLRPSGEHEVERTRDHARRKSEEIPQSEAPRISMVHLGSMTNDIRPDSLAMFGTKASNFSRPYTATTPPPAMLNGWSSNQSPAGSFPNSPNPNSATSPPMTTQAINSPQDAYRAYTSPQNGSQGFTSPPTVSQGFTSPRTGPPGSDGLHPAVPRSNPSVPSTPGSNPRPLHSPSASYSLTPTISPIRPHTSHHPSTSIPPATATSSSDMSKRISPPQPLPPISQTSPKLTVDVGNYVSPFKSSIIQTSATNSPESTAAATFASPRRIRRRKDPTPFNVMVVGATNSGKSSFIEFLRSSFPAPPERHMSGAMTPVTTPRIPQPQGSFYPSYTETELDGERVALTFWDSQSLEKNVVDLQLRELIAFVESKFEDTFNEEQKVARTQGARDTHIHCVFLLLDPSRLDYNFRQAYKQHKGPSSRSDISAGLDPELDISVLKGLTNKTTVIPVISKADSLTKTQLMMMKRRAWQSMQIESLDPLAAIEAVDEDDESDSSLASAEFPPGLGLGPVRLARSNGSDAKDSAVDSSFSSNGKSSSSATSASPPQVKQTPNGHQFEEVPIPYSMICPDPDNRSVKGRAFAWGVADPMDPKHCDFVRLRDTIFYELRDDLRAAARERWYETWRTSRLKRAPIASIRRAPGHSPLGIVTPGEGDSPTVPISLTSMRTPLTSHNAANTVEPKIVAANGENERPVTATKVKNFTSPAVASMSTFPLRRP